MAAPSSTHSGCYISWPSLDLLIFMISKAASVSQAISGIPDGFGMKFYNSNTAFSYDGGFHWVAIAFKIENCPRDPTAEHTSTPPSRGHRTIARSGNYGSQLARSRDQKREAKSNQAGHATVPF